MPRVPAPRVRVPHRAYAGPAGGGPPKDPTTSRAAAEWSALEPAEAAHWARPDAVQRVPGAPARAYFRIAGAFATHRCPHPLWHGHADRVDDQKESESPEASKSGEKLRAVLATQEEMLRYYRQAATIRRMETAADGLYKARKVCGFCHLGVGQEAVAVGLEAAFDPARDALITAYRCHAAALLRGASLRAVLAELLGRRTGVSAGKGGSMHMYASSFFGGNGIVGAQVPLGVGVALAQKLQYLSNPNGAGGGTSRRVPLIRMGSRGASRSDVGESRDAAVSGNESSHQNSRTSQSNAPDASRDTTRSGSESTRDIVRTGQSNAPDASRDTTRSGSESTRDNVRTGQSQSPDASRDTTRSGSESTRDNVRTGQSQSPDASRDGHEMRMALSDDDGAHTCAPAPATHAGGVTFALYGDGAANQGQVAEAMNIAALHGLPAVFVCENNFYGMGTSIERSAASTAFYTRGDYLPGVRVPAMDVLAVREAARFASAWVRSGRGPIVLEMVTYRYAGHSMSDPGTSYRPRAEVQRVRAERDVLRLLRRQIEAAAFATADELDAIDEEIRAEVDAAVAAAEADDPPDPQADLFTDVYADSGISLRGVLPPSLA